MNYSQTTTVSPQLNAAEAQQPVAVKPLSPWRAILYFLVGGLGLRLSIYGGMPRLVDLGLTSFEAFVVVFTVPVAILFALAFASAKWEGVPLNAPALAQRFRLQRISGRQILWLGAGILLLLAGVFFVTPAGNWLLNTFPAIQPPAAFPPALNPMLQNQELPAVIADWLGPEAAGNWALVVLVLIMFFFNTFGEELYWRGVIFPRQELVHGRWTWLVHGLMWNLFHLPIYPWYVVAGLPVTLTISWLAQKTGNTWMPIILHAFGNIFMYSLIISVVARGV